LLGDDGYVSNNISACATNLKLKLLVAELTTPWAIKTWHFTFVHIFTNY